MYNLSDLNIPKAAIFQKQITGILNLFPEVKWDRWAGENFARVSIFGWIEREDGRSDFLLLFIVEGEIGAVWTSSAEHSMDFAARLGMSGDHKGCRRVETYFPLAQTAIRLKEAAA